MSDNKTVQSDVSKTETENEVILRSQVDIYEDANGIILKADLPGVPKEGLNIELDGETLTIEGRASIETPEGTEVLYADVMGTRYVRSFSLSGGLEADGVNAELKNGELTLVIPKRAEVQPRKIEVKAS